MASKITLAMAIVLAGGPLWGQELQNNIVSQLQSQGFTRIEINRTFLGRTRIVATRKNLWREIVINPSTGMILRDYSVDKEQPAGRSARKGLFNTSPGADGGDRANEGAGASGGDAGGDSGDGGDDGGDGNEGDDGGDGNEGDDGGDGNEGDSGDGDSGDGDGGDGDGGGDEGDSGDD